MMQTNQRATTWLQWVKVIPTQGLPPFWYRTSQLLSGLDSSEQAGLLQKLRTAQRVFNEPNGLYLQAAVMSKAEKQRLRHLLSFEVGGFKLETFRLTTALFAKEGQHYHCMSELVEQGHLPLPSIAHNPQNVCITGPGGQLLEVFVPVGLIKLNFTIHHA